MSKKTRRDGFRGTVRGWTCVLALVAALAVGGGAAPALAQGAGAPEAVSLDQLPADVSMVISASILRMRGIDDPRATAPVTFSAEAATALLDREFGYEGFLLIGVVLSEWTVLVADPAMLGVYAQLIFADPSRRRTVASLFAAYGFSDRNLEVVRASVATLAPPVPEMRLFIVPAADVPAHILDAAGGELALRAHVAEKAVGAGGTEISTAPQDYYIFAFAADRLPIGAEVGLRIGNTPEGIEGNSGNAITVDFQGWQVALARGTFAINSGQEMFFKAVYRPAASALDANPAQRLAGILSSNAVEPAAVRLQGSR